MYKKTTALAFMALAVLAVSVTVSHNSAIYADIESGYTIGPLTATGIGMTEPQARAQAFSTMFDVLDEIETNLGPCEYIEYFVVIKESYGSAIYKVEFNVIIGMDGGPPGM